ncbi:MAG: DUF2914 domain-containing protein [Holophaga sp.]|nr:DUF2914 domain-containing protein [Holophaga sp.]
MRKGFLLAVGVSLVLAGVGVAIARQAPLQATAAAEPSAEVKVGTGIEKMEITGEAASFKVAPGTKIYIWTKVSGCADSTISIAFHKGDKASTPQELKVPRSPYRTNAYRTFRAGDEGAWVARVLDSTSKEIGSVAFTVELE